MATHLCVASYNIHRCVGSDWRRDVPRVADFSRSGAVLDAVQDLEIDGVLTVQAERAVPMVAELAEALGLPGIGVETARLLTNKLAMARSDQPSADLADLAARLLGWLPDDG